MTRSKRTAPEYRYPCRRRCNGDYGFEPLEVKDLFTGALAALAGECKAYYSRQVSARALARQPDVISGRAKLSLGSGPTVHDGWLGLDHISRTPHIYAADLRLPLPLRDGCAMRILAEHCFEHLAFDDVERLVAECWRVLVPGGVLRIVSPDAQFIASLILAPTDSLLRYVEYDHRLHRWTASRMDRWKTINRLSHQWGQHRSLLSANMLEPMLTEHGFSDIAVCESGRTKWLDEVPDVHGVYFDNNAETFTLEARRAS